MQELGFSGETVHDVLADLPLIQPEIIILSKNEMEVRNVKVENKKLLTELDCSLVVASKVFQRSNVSKSIVFNFFSSSLFDICKKLDQKDGNSVS